MKPQLEVSATTADLNAHPSEKLAPPASPSSTEGALVVHQELLQFLETLQAPSMDSYSSLATQLVEIFKDYVNNIDKIKAVSDSKY
ncbi:hypothetical protein Nepgr_019291 [Nepenthes gracilis]|uniref:Uncharacterized protein n=1 Tax=Nepenthes gracilis TaxID=150966 RepID=A0AAD3STA0_NEPGR|nr:hypothetical protein Nepgr_019291 [Nepenthes gracilis]